MSQRHDLITAFRPEPRPAAGECYAAAGTRTGVGHVEGVRLPGKEGRHDAKIRIAAAAVMVAAGFIGAVAAPATAGKTLKLVGEFEATPAAVSMKVKVKHGKPKFVKDIRLSGLEMTCPDPLDPLNPVPTTHTPTTPAAGSEKIRVKAGTEYSKVLSNAAIPGSKSRDALGKNPKLSTGEMDLTRG